MSWVQDLIVKFTPGRQKSDDTRTAATVQGKRPNESPKANNSFSRLFCCALMVVLIFAALLWYPCSFSKYDCIHLRALTYKDGKQAEKKEHQY